MMPRMIERGERPFQVYITDSETSVCYHGIWYNFPNAMLHTHNGLRNGIREELEVHHIRERLEELIREVGGE